MKDLFKPFTRKQRQDLLSTIAILEGKQAQIIREVDDRIGMFATSQEVNQVVMLDIQLAQLRGKLNTL